MNRFLRRKTTGELIFDFFNYTFMVIFAFLVIYPFWDLFLLSFSDQLGSSSLGFKFWNSSWHTDAYSFIFKNNKIYIAYYNTIYRTVIGTVLSLIVVLLAAYPLSKKNLPFRNYITIFFLIPMFFSGGLIPTYLLIRSLNLLDKRWVLIIPTLMNIFNMIIVRNFIMAMDNELEEAAHIDGASYFTILWVIVAPLSKAVLATVALWTMVGHWNSWFDALIYTRRENLIVLQILVRRMIMMQIDDTQSLQAFERMRQTRIPTAAVRASTIIVTIGPIVVAYPFLQKHFVKGIMIGSLKG